MNIPARAIYVSTFLLFLTAVAYVGYVGEGLKGKIPDTHRAILLIGFIVGAGAVARYCRTMMLARYMESRERRRRAGAK